MALFRAAAAAGLLLVLAPEQTRTAIASIFSSADEARKSLPDQRAVAESAIAFCQKNPATCTEALRKTQDLPAQRP